jgi:hypothetical protein
MNEGAMRTQFAGGGCCRSMLLLEIAEGAGANAVEAAKGQWGNGPP